MGRTELAFYGRSANLWGRFPNILHRGLGLGQWTDTADGGRRHTLLLDYAKGKNKMVRSAIAAGLYFDGDAPGSRTAADNVASKVAATIPELTTYFLTVWEGNPGDKLGERIQAAQNWFTFFSRSGTPIGGSGSEVFAQYKEKCNHYPQTEKQKQDKAG